MKYTLYDEDVYIVGYALSMMIDKALEDGDKKRAALMATVFEDLDSYVMAENSNDRGFKVVK